MVEQEIMFLHGRRGLLLPGRAARGVWDMILALTTHSLDTHTHTSFLRVKNMGVVNTLENMEDQIKEMGGTIRMNLLDAAQDHGSCHNVVRVTRSQT